MTSGVIVLQFSTAATQDEIASCVQKIYNFDECIIGMQYREFKSPEPIIKMLNYIDKMEDKT